MWPESPKPLACHSIETFADLFAGGPNSPRIGTPVNIGTPPELGPPPPHFRTYCLNMF